MSFSLQFLGSGTSAGVPQIGCTCATCTSPDPRDKRWRSGVYVRTSRTGFVIDTPPEFRLACVALGIRKVDALVITHAHMDHIAGFDDVRRFNTLNGGAPLVCFATPETIDSLRAIFPYITEKANAQGLYRPMIHYTPVTESFKIGDVTLTPLPVVHGPRTNGYLMESQGHRIAYVPDCIIMPPDVRARIHGVDVLVLDCLRAMPHPTHMNREQALACIADVSPKRAFLTHMSHNVLHKSFEETLPAHVRLAYDGLKVVEVDD